MIPYSDFVRLLAEAAKFDSFEGFAAAHSGSVPIENQYKAVALLMQIWTLGHDGLSIDSIRSVAGVTLAELCRDYGIPYRTAQDWKAGKRKPPEWLLPMAAYAVLSDLFENSD